MQSRFEAVAEGWKASAGTSQQPDVFAGLGKVFNASAAADSGFAAFSTEAGFVFAKLVLSLPGYRQVGEFILDWAARHGADLNLVDG